MSKFEGWGGTHSAVGEVGTREKKVYSSAMRSCEKVQTQEQQEPAEDPSLCHVEKEGGKARIRADDSQHFASIIDEILPSIGSKRVHFKVVSFP